MNRWDDGSQREASGLLTYLEEMSKRRRHSNVMMSKRISNNRKATS